MKNKLIFLLLLISLSLPVSVAHASSIKIDDSVYINKNKTTTESLFASGRTITIDGNISGDLIALAQNININGHIDGDLIAIASQNINVNGSIDGNIRTISRSITINSLVTRNISSIAQNIIFDKDSIINWNAYLVSSQAILKGTINGNLNGIIKQLILSSKVNNIKVKTKKSLIVNSDAEIKGSFVYTSPNKATISGQAKLNSSPQYNNYIDKDYIFWNWALLFKILSSFVVGLALIYLGKKKVIKITSIIQKRPQKTILPGLILSLVFPPIIIILSFTIIGIPLAIILLFLWLIFLYLSQILIAISLGQLILKKLKLSNSLLPALIIGTIICWLLFSTPFIGWIISLLTIWLGLGGIWLYAYNKS